MFVPDLDLVEWIPLVKLPPIPSIDIAQHNLTFDPLLYVFKKTFWFSTIAAAYNHRVTRLKALSRSERPIQVWLRTGRNGRGILSDVVLCNACWLALAWVHGGVLQVSEKDPSVAVCLGPDTHKAASLAARWTHAFPHTLALTAKT